MAKLDSLLKGYKEPVEARPCTELLKVRRQLQHMLPGYSGIVDGIYLRRTTHWDEYSYWFNDVEVTLDEAIDIVLKHKEPPAPKAEIFQFDLRLETEEARPRKLHSRKPRKALPPIQGCALPPKQEPLYTLPLFSLAGQGAAA